MNFETAFKQGQESKNMGLPMGKGLKSVYKAIGGIQKARSYAIASSPKVGKTTLVDCGFVIEPCLYILNYNQTFDEKLEKLKSQIESETDVDKAKELNHEYSEVLKGRKFYHVKYLSYEIDRVTKEFDWVAHFLNRDYDIWKIPLPQGKTYKGKKYVIISPNYLSGQLTYDSEDENNFEIIKVSAELEDKIIKVYKNRIIPLLGRYDENNKRIQKGMIDFIEYKDNPTGVRNMLLGFAKKRGEFKYTEFKKSSGQVSKRIIGYKPHNPDEHVLIITDHVRKLIPERKFTLKQTVDKFSEYTVELRNFCKYSFVHVIHLNRAMADVGRRKLDDDRIYPTAEDIKDTGKKHYYVFICFI